jgi:DNA-binding LacI/PurR family transcriptional regulator
MQLVVDHLHELGHRDVFVINGPEGWYSTAKRRRGVEERCAVHGMRIVGAEAGDWSVASGYAAAAAIPAAATAVIAANDEMALGALAAVWENGRSVPGELSVTGFDDMRIAPYARPGLTTIHVDFRASGQLAIQRLLQMIAPEVAERRPKVTPVPPRLVARGSTARVVTGAGR